MDLRDQLPRKKGSVKAESLVYISDGSFIGFNTVSRSKMPLGIGFVRKLKNGIKRNKNGGIKWYSGVSNELNKSLSNIRKWYGVKVGGNGYRKIKVVHYNCTTIEQIINQLKN